MNDEIKTEDIIKSLRICAQGNPDACAACAYSGIATCYEELCEDAADRLERLRGKLNAARLENELLRGVLNSSGHSGEMREMKIDVKQLSKIASAAPIAEYNGRKLYTGTWHHFKGKDYFVCGTAVHTETNEILVLYKDSLVSSKQYARPLSMFMSEVDREKYPDAPQKYRFERGNELLKGALAEMNETSDRTSCDERIMQQAIKTYGVQAQCDVAIEEMAELTKAIMKIRRVADDYEKTQTALENLLEEIADVDIMIDQLKIMWGPKQVEECRKKKLERLDRRLEGVINDL